MTFALVSTLTYLACEWFNLPAFTYHPATNRVGWWWEAGRSGEGPAMYWYGWSAMTLAVGLVAGLLGTLLPERVVNRIPLFLVWLLPLLVFHATGLFADAVLDQVARRQGTPDVQARSRNHRRRGYRRRDA